MNLFVKKKINIIIHKSQEKINSWIIRNKKSPKYIYLGAEEIRLLTKNKMEIKEYKNEKFYNLILLELPNHLELDIDWGAEPKIIISETKLG